MWQSMCAQVLMVLATLKASRATLPADSPLNYGPQGRAVQYNHNSITTGVGNYVPFHHALGGKDHGRFKDVDEIRFVFTNDIHSREDSHNHMGVDCNPIDHEEGTCYGGAARRKTIIDALRRGHEWTYVLDAGDVSEGHPLFGYYNGEVSAAVMKHIGYHAVTLGNHEFDRGIKNLAQFLPKLGTTVICSNINMDKAPELAAVVKPFVIFEGPQKQKVGIIGLITTATASITLGADGVSFEDPVHIVQHHIDELKTKHKVNIIVALSHNGYEQDKDMASRTSGLLAIFGGHSHTYLSTDEDDPEADGKYPTIMAGEDGQPVYIVQAKKFGEYVGFLDLSITKAGQVVGLSGQPIHITSNIPEDRALKQFIAEVRKPMDEKGKLQLWATPVDLRQETCKRGECRLANMVTDAMLYIAEKYPPFAKPDGPRAPIRIALINSDVMRSGLRQGPISMLHMMGIFPNTNQLVEAELSGKQIRDMIIGSITQINPYDQQPVTCFLHVAGLKVEYNFKAKHVQEIYIRSDILPLPKDPTPAVPVAAGHVSRQPANPQWQVLKPENHYRVLTTDFIALGGDHILAPKIPYKPIVRLTAMLAQYLKEVSEPYIELDQRLVQVPPSIAASA
ncbi:hypothetical protein H4R35_001616 [Dimargaris xerosporica]|nr:hypothetical protein H4R35_001616 [Dimargaris xerosporica]